MVQMDHLDKLRSLPGPEDIHRQTLSNGITILTRSNFNSPSVVISGYVAAGSYLDPEEKLGLAHFTATALMRGTANRSFQEIFNELESVGASLGFGASVHNTSFSARSLSEDLPLVMRLFADCLRNPVFPQAYVDRLQAQPLTSLAIRAQDTAEMSALTFDKLLFQEHPYGKPEDGFTETIHKIKQGDLVDFHKRYYRPQGMVIVVVGAVYTQDVFQIIESELGSWQNPEPEPLFKYPPVTPPQTTTRQHIELAGKSQTDLIMGTLGPRRCSPDFLPASLGNNVLGQFGMMGRIGEVVREKAGLAYDASTSLNAWIEGGSWEVTAGVNPTNLEKAIALIIRELQRFIKEPVTMEELADSQANYIGRLPLTLESNAGVANSILNLERFDLGLDYLQRYNSLISEVTPASVLETARKYIDPEKLVIVSSGTSKGKEA
jgi:zinc protease